MQFYLMEQKKTNKLMDRKVFSIDISAQNAGQFIPVQ